MQDGGSSFELLADLQQEGKLSLRIYAWGELDGDWDLYARRQRAFPAHHPFLAVGALKGFVDGTLGSATAALLEPYAGRKTARGTLNHDQAELDALVRRAASRFAATSFSLSGRER